MRKTTFLLTLALSATFLVAPQSVDAATLYQARLSGANEVPAVMSTGSGFAQVEINDAMDTIVISGRFRGLLANDVAAHIHCCALPTANAGVAIDTPSIPGVPTGVRSGVFSASFSLLDALNYNPPFVTNNGGTAISARDTLIAGLMGGRAYFNIHTTQFPGGEIRGNFQQVPEPASWAMMIAGFGLIGGTLRARRRSSIAGVSLAG